MFDSSGPKYSIHPHAGNGKPGKNGYADMSDDEISLQDIFDVLMKGKWVILACVVGVLFLVGLYTVLKAPEYEASSMLYVNKQQSSPRLGELMGLESGSNDVANEIEILKSRTIALNVADELMEREVAPGTDEPLTILRRNSDDEPVSRYDVMNRLRDGGYVQIQPVSREVDLINVIANSTIPEEAALIADLYATEYVEFNRMASRRQMAASREFLDDMTETFRQELEMAEDTLTTYVAQEQVVAPTSEVEQLYEQLRDLRQRRYEAQLERTAARTRLRDYRRTRDEIREELPTQIASGEDLTIERLRQRISEKVTEIEERLARDPSLRNDPTQDAALMRLRQEVAELQDQVDERAREVVRQAAAEAGYEMQGDGVSNVQARLGRLSSIQAQIARLEAEETVQEARLQVIDENIRQYTAELNQIPNKEIAMGRLERAMETQETIYLSMVEQLQSARVAEESELGYVDIVDEALVPENPVRPRAALNLALGFILGLMLGVGGAFVRNMVDNKIRRPEDLQRAGHSLIGTVPDMTPTIKEDFDGKERVTVDGRAYSTSLISLLNPLAPTAESYRRLRTNLQFSRPDSSVKSVLVTSSAPGEGKSVTSMNLAITMAQMGRKTVYLDTDLRRSSGHEMFGVQREPGLVDILFEPYPQGLNSFGTEVDDFYLIPAGSKVPNPAEVIGSQKMVEFMTRLRNEFDIIVVDTPPVLVVSDALLLAASCDATLLVCSAGDTPHPALSDSVDSLYEVGANLSGVVLNRFHPKKGDGRYGYGYGYGYEPEYKDSETKTFATLR